MIVGFFCFSLSFFFFLFMQSSPQLSPPSLLLPPRLLSPSHPHLRLFLPVTPVTSRPSLQHQHQIHPPWMDPQRQNVTSKFFKEIHKVFPMERSSSFSGDLSFENTNRRRACLLPFPYMQHYFIHKQIFS